MGTIVAMTAEPSAKEPFKVKESRTPLILALVGIGAIIVVVGGIFLLRGSAIEETVELSTYKNTNYPVESAVKDQMVSDVAALVALDPAEPDATEEEILGELADASYKAGYIPMSANQNLPEVSTPGYAVDGANLILARPFESGVCTVALTVGAGVTPGNINCTTYLTAKP